MKITVINGTEKHGVTYRLKEIFLKIYMVKRLNSKNILLVHSPRMSISGI